MVYCVQAHLVFATQTIRNNRLATAQNAINTKPRWGDSTVTPSDLNDEGQTEWAVNVDSRFEAKQDQQTIETQVLGLSGLQASSWVQVHDCPHDSAAPPPCVVERRTTV